MKRKEISGILLFSLALISLIFGSIIAPRLLVTLPSRYQILLPDSIYAAVHTPLPQTLPKPVPIVTSESQGDGGSPGVIQQMSPMPPLSFSRAEQQHEPSSQWPSSEASSTPILTPKPDELVPTKMAPNQTLIKGLKIIPQKFNNCGPANLSIVLNFYGVQDDQVEIGDQLKPNYEDRNVSPEELARYVNEKTDLRAAVFRGGDISNLRLILSAGYPVVIEKGLMLDPREGWMGHYLTLSGYDDLNEVFIGQDTFLGPWDSRGREIDYQEISEQWHHFNNTFLIIAPPDEFEKIISLLPPSFADSKSMWEHAVQRAKRLVGEDATNPFSWFNLGSSLTHLGLESGDFDYYHSATDAFDQARRIGLPWRMLWYQFEPYQAYLATGRIDDVMLLTEAILIYQGGRNIEETYLYRGHALIASGDREAARRAYKKALDLNPSIYEASRALQVLESDD